MRNNHNNGLTEDIIKRHRQDKRAKAQAERKQARYHRYLDDVLDEEKEGYEWPDDSDWYE